MPIKKLATFSLACGSLIAVCSIGSLSAVNAATTHITGPNNASINDGYYATSGGPYEVDSSVALNGYSGNGIAITAPTSNPITVTVDSGAQFNNNGVNGGYFNAVTFTDNGGTYANNYNGLYIDNSNVTLNNANVNGSIGDGISLVQSNVSIYGGQYGGNNKLGFANGGDIFSDSSNVTIYGDFGSLNGQKFVDTSGSASGTFKNGGGVQTFTYNLVVGGSIQFVYAAPIVTATPEPTSLVALMIGALSLTGLLLRRKGGLSV